MVQAFSCLINNNKKQHSEYFTLTAFGYKNGYVNVLQWNVIRALIHFLYSYAILEPTLNYRRLSLKVHPISSSQVHVQEKRINLNTLTEHKYNLIVLNPFTIKKLHSKEVGFKYIFLTVYRSFNLVLADGRRLRLADNFWLP
jgi:hypothetical protein